MSFPVLYLWPLASKPLLVWYAGSLTGWAPPHLGSAFISVSYPLGYVTLP